MKLIGKLIVIVILVGALLSASAYVIFYTDNGNDTESPKITYISGNLTVTAGQTVTITTQFTDNVNVTVATLYYKSADAANWFSESILNGSADILVPSTATNNVYYYITVDDAAGNGPVGDPSTDGSTYYVITVQPAGGDHGNETLTHTVFIEEATADWCINCPEVADILSSLYESNKYNFYYVALINKSNPDTTHRLWTDYNILSFPTVFIDGGYKVLIGSKNAESIYTDAISASRQRALPKLKITVTAQLKNTSNTTKDVIVNTLIENRGNGTYNGRLKLYLTEMVSHLSDYNSRPYHFGLLEYLIDTDISIAGKQNITKSVTKDISAYDYENLIIIGVVFSSQKNAVATIPDFLNAFDAYYADATNATKVVPKGNLPPQLEITSPQKGKIYLNGRPILVRLQERKIFGAILHNLAYNKTILLGKKIVTVNASDDSAVAKVEFSIDGTVMANDTQAPYEFTFNKLKLLKSLFFKNHILTVTVYDDAGKTTSSSIVFKARI